MAYRRVSFDKGRVHCLSEMCPEKGIGPSSALEVCVDR